MKLSLSARLRRALSPRRWARKPLTFGAVVALVVGLGTGTAFAFFTTLGTGSGTASVGTPLSVTVEQATGTVTNLLYPGASGDLKVTLDNPNSYPVTIVAIQGNGPVAVSSAGIGTCNTTGVAVVTQSGVSIPVASDANPPNNPVSVVVSDGVSMDATSDSGCQGATFSVPVLVTV
ncbi:MAG: hypothetical protein JWM55_1231, partial [Acidimicrobiaceae bacterium]|nr:hypothetical protein [Acidimicrobiaceae bacterium]